MGNKNKRGYVLPSLDELCAVEVLCIEGGPHGLVLLLEEEFEDVVGVAEVDVLEVDGGVEVDGAGVLAVGGVDPDDEVGDVDVDLAHGGVADGEAHADGGGVLRVVVLRLGLHSGHCVVGHAINVNVSILCAVQYQCPHCLSCSISANISTIRHIRSWILRRSLSSLFLCDALKSLLG